MTRPAFAPTDEQRRLVRSLATYGIPQDRIAAEVINPETGDAIDPKTLRLHFRAELNTGNTKATAQVAQALFNNAVKKNNVVAQIFWLKTQARWSETPQKIELTGEAGGPIEFTQLSDSERVRRLSAILGRASAGGTRPAADDGGNGPMAAEPGAADGRAE